MPKHLVISTSGNPDSNSRRMGRIAFAALEKAKVDCGWLDIDQLDLPMCDADTCYTQPAAQKLSTTIEEADGINKLFEERKEIVEQSRWAISAAIYLWPSEPYPSCGHLSQYKVTSSVVVERFHLL